MGPEPTLEAERSHWQPHHYGSRVHVLADAWMHSALARIGSPSTTHTELIALVRAVYARLTQLSCGRELPTVETRVETRMREVHPEAGVWRGRVLDPTARVVVIDVIRGGIVPAQVCFEMLTGVLPIENLRLDHLSLSRTTDDGGRVKGVDLSASKVGGSIQGASVILPDPMGATGSTALRALEHLIEGHGRPARILLLPMICTPEFLRAVLERHEQLVVYTGRLDRGLSDPDVLATLPGTHWDRERGLDERGYVVPGAGGIGEVLNNSWC